MKTYILIFVFASIFVSSNHSRLLPEQKLFISPVYDNYIKTYKNYKYYNEKDFLLYGRGKYEPKGYIYIPEKYEEVLILYSNHYNVPFTIMAKIALCESSWRKWAKGGNEEKGFDLGLMQLNTRSIPTFEKLFNKGNKIDPYNERTAMRIACAYISDLYKQTGNYYLAVAAYNCGINAVKRKKIPESTYKYVSKVFGKRLDKYQDLVY